MFDVDQEMKQIAKYVVFILAGGLILLAVISLIVPLYDIYHAKIDCIVNDIKQECTTTVDKS